MMSTANFRSLQSGDASRATNRSNSVQTGEDSADPGWGKGEEDAKEGKTIELGVKPNIS